MLYYKNTSLCVSCNTLYHTTSHLCNTLHHTASHSSTSDSAHACAWDCMNTSLCGSCNTLQHTATQCNTCIARISVRGIAWILSFYNTNPIKVAPCPLSKRGGGKLRTTNKKQAMLHVDFCYLNVGWVIMGPGALRCRKGFGALLTHISAQEPYDFSKPLEWTSFPPLVTTVLITPQSAESPGSGHVGV